MILGLGLYLRLIVSDDALTNIAVQEDDLRAIAEREGWLVSQVLTDDGISGRKDQPKTTEALDIISTRNAEVVAVRKLDR